MSYWKNQGSGRSSILSFAVMKGFWSKVTFGFSLFALSGAFAAQTTTTIYVGRHFEVRDYDQPIKYVFDEETRVARITGSLHNNPRVQRLRVLSGWNLCSLAVTATNVVGQANNAQPNTIDSILAWDQPTLSWNAVSLGDTLPAGAILWLHSATNADLTLIGPYAHPTNSPVNGNGIFMPGAGLEAWNLKAALSNLVSPVAFIYDPTTFRWLSHFPSPLEQQSDLPVWLPPGSAFFVQSDAPGELVPPEPVLRIRYYHEDHLGSSSVLADDEGEVLEETAFYPFGAPRNGFQPQRIYEPYQFTRKERDRESGLNYFDTRYLAAPLGRFVGVDVKYANADALSLEDLSSFLNNPQKNNLYAYVLNNPLKFVDPTGMDNRQAQPKVLIVYTKDMWADAQSRMKITDQAAYENALKVTYQKETGANADVVVKQLKNWKQLGNDFKGSSFETVIVNTHAYGNHKSLFMGEKKNLDEIDVGGLERFIAGAKTAPKKMFFYGCNTATSGLASDLSKRLPNTEITGATKVIKQTVKFPDSKDKSKFSITENRAHNATYKGGEMISHSRTFDPKTAPIVP